MILDYFSNFEIKINIFFLLRINTYIVPLTIQQAWATPIERNILRASKN